MLLLAVYYCNFFFKDGRPSEKPPGSGVHVFIRCYQCFIPRCVRSATVRGMRSASWGSGWTPSSRSWPASGGSGKSWPRRARPCGRRRCASAVTALPTLLLLLLRLPPLHRPPRRTLAPPPPLHPCRPPPLPPPRSTATASWIGWGRDRQGLRRQNQWGTWSWAWTNKSRINRRWVTVDIGIREHVLFIKLVSLVKYLNHLLERLPRNMNPRLESSQSCFWCHQEVDLLWCWRSSEIKCSRPFVV